MAKMSLAFDEFGRPFLIIKVRPVAKIPASFATIWRFRLPAHGATEGRSEVCPPSDGGSRLDR